MLVRQGGRSLIEVALLAGCVLLGLLTAAPASAAELLPEYQRSFGPDGTAATGFERAGSTAIDQSTHAVYVIDRKAGSGESSLLKFDAEGNPLPFGGLAPYISGNRLSGLTFPSGPSEAQVAVDSKSHTIYVTSGNTIKAFHADGEPSEFSAGPGAGGNEIGGFNELLGLAVDSNGTIYASDYPTTVKIFTHSGEPVTDFEAGNGIANLAVDASGTLYVNRWLDTVRKFEPTTFPVTPATTYSFAGVVDPNVSYSVAVDPATNDVYIAEADGFAPEPRIARYSEDGVLLATFAGPGEEGEITVSEGVAVDGGTGNIFVSNVPESGLSQVELFTPYTGIPVIVSLSVANVSSDAATLRAQINPGRAETMYHFEYGLSDCSSGGCKSVPAGGTGIGGGHLGVEVSEQITGLKPATTYHYRIVASNGFGDNLGSERDHTFTTQTNVLDFRLADERAWEMVSPPDKHGAQVDPTPELAQAAADGDGFMYAAVGSVEEHPAGSRAFEPSAILARRGPQGWTSADLTPPNDEVEGVRTESPYKLFNGDLSRGLLEPRTATRLSPEAYGKTPYLRLNAEPPVYQALVTQADLQPGTEGGLFTIVGASRKRDHVAFTSSVPLVENAPPAPARSPYLWTAGEVKPISVLPASEGGAVVATDLIGSGSGSTRHAISEDGSRVFWSTGTYVHSAAKATTGLYLRDTVAGETVRLDKMQPDATGLGIVRPTFQGASADGTVVFFTDSQQLTAGAGTSGRDLYRCELPPGSPPSDCTGLTNITAPTQNPGESAEVQGIAPGVAEDGRTIYFVARGVLDVVANEAGEEAAQGESNLYVWQEGTGVRFIATLAPGDENNWGGSTETEGSVTATSSPSGRYLSFMSQRGLAGRSSIDAASGEPVQQVYRFDASADRLDCVSCKQTGGAPDGELIGIRRVDPRGLWNGSWVAASLPERSIKDAGWLSFYAPRAVLDNGRVFFNSIDSLVPADSNRQWDVYQYEPTGTGGCGNASEDAGTVLAARGCVSLLSSGTAEEDAAFLDASESGDDVFFFTSAQLNAIDEDLVIDVYDARVGGVPGTRPVSTECRGDACQKPTGAPGESIPGSSSYVGPGNPKAGRRCPRGKRLVRRKGKRLCIRKARRHKRHHHSRGGPHKRPSGPSGVSR